MRAVVGQALEPIAGWEGSGQAFLSRCLSLKKKIAMCLVKEGGNNVPGVGSSLYKVLGVVHC